MPLTDEQLADQAQAGDRRAMEELVHRYQEKAYGIAYHMSGDREEAQDLTQEAFLKAFRNIKKFKKRSSFYTWFYRILVNACLDGRRRRRRWEKIFTFWRPFKSEENNGKKEIIDTPDVGHDKNPFEVLRGKQVQEETLRALESLPEKQRQVFQLKVFHDMSINEIAQVMDSAEGTVKSHLFRATQSLRRSLKDWVGKEEEG
jgi:RNA polymerase sigma-70 factor (ECF subfamily)